MVRYIAGNSPKDTATARERILLPMVQRIQVNGLEDDITEWDSAYGRMVEYTRENGGMGRHMGTGWKNVSTVRYDMKACGITIFQSENDDDAGNAHLHPLIHTTDSLTIFQIGQKPFYDLFVGTEMISCSQK
jgi:hypothetical protein